MTSEANGLMDATEDTPEDIPVLPERIVPPLEKRERAFRGALAVAFLIHASFFIQITRTAPKTLGDPSGLSDAIAVEIVSLSDLKSRETVALPPPGAPAAAPAPPPAPPETVRATEPEREAPPPKQPETAPEPAPPEAKPEPPPTPAKPAPSAAEPARQTAELPDFSASLPKLAELPPPSETEQPEAEPEAEKAAEDPQEKTAEKPPEPKPQPKPKESPPPAAKKRAALEAPPPRDQASAPPGRSTAATRPPGITRSGENDAFGLAVVRALRATMPPPRGVLGSVVVRLTLTENGDLQTVTVLEPSGRRGLDESVVFATKQTYFPLPPYKSTLADRTFTIRYVYR